MKFSINDLMKQAQELKTRLEGAQAELAQVEVCGESGGGLVQVTINGQLAVRRVTIDPSLVGDDREMLEDLIVAAMNDALRRVEAKRQEKMGLGGLPFQFPFAQ